MRRYRTICCLLFTAGWSIAGSLDFAVSANLVPLYSAFAADAQGDILIATAPSTCNLPTVNPLSACGPLWIGKLDPTGQRLLFATYLGKPIPQGSFGSGEAPGIAVDANGNIIVAATDATGVLPTVNAVQSAPGSNFNNLYIAKLTPDGSRLTYATYLGGSGAQTALSLAVDSAGAAYVSAFLSTPDFPTTPQSAHDPPGLYSTAVVKLSAEGKLQYGVTFPFEFYTSVKPLQLDSSGGALLASNLEILRVAPDGSSLARTQLPAWAVAASPWALPRPGGGFQFAGTSAGGVPIPNGALEPYADANVYIRIEDGLARQPYLPAPVSGIAVDPQDGNRIYAATSAGLYVSLNNGWDWSLLRAGACLAILVDPFDSNRLYLSVDAAPQMLRSTDRGATFTPTASGLSPGVRIRSLAADPNIPGLLYGAGGSVFRSKDGGDTWDARSVGPSGPNLSPSASTFTTAASIQTDPTHAGWAYVLGTTSCIGFCPVTQNLSRTTNAGDSWGNAFAPAADPLVSSTGAFAVDPTTGDVAEAVNNSNGATGSTVVIYRNADPAAAELLYTGETRSIAFDGQHPGTIYLAVHTEGPGAGYFVIKSADEGATWTSATSAALDRPAYNLTVGAGAVLHASQIPNPPIGFVAAADSTGAIQSGTYLGGAFTQVNAAASLNGNVFVAGMTQGGLPTADSAQPATGGATDGFAAAFDDSGALLWSTYLGGSGADSIDWIVPLADGSAIVIGTTDPADFPMLQASPLGPGSAFLAHIRP